MAGPVEMRPFKIATAGIGVAIGLSARWVVPSSSLDMARSILGPCAALAIVVMLLWLLRRDRRRGEPRRSGLRRPPPGVQLGPMLKRIARGGRQVSGGYPNPTPGTWPIVLAPEVRGEGTISRTSDGDYRFYSGAWQTIHGRARVLRSDGGAFIVWGAQLSDGRRVFCRRSTTPGYGPSGYWRRRSDDGRSWVVGEIRLEPDNVYFSDGTYRRPIAFDGNPFERAIARQPDFIRALQDDSFAFTFNRALWEDALCTADGTIGWNPSRGEAAATIAKLRGFGENYSDFKFGGPEPQPPLTAPEIIVEALARVGWRFQTDDELKRFDAQESEESRRQHDHLMNPWDPPRETRS